MDRTELATFLRAHRARLRPADVGLPAGTTRRRTPGLRREEVAELSGVGITWYTWLEQGRPISTSAQVVDALARALRLDPDQHRHLRALAGLPVPGTETAADDVFPRLQRLVDAVSPNLAVIYDRRFDYIAWNTPYVRVRHDPGALPRERRNLLWMMFTDTENRARMARWEPAARAVLSQFRAVVGQRPNDHGSSRWCPRWPRRAPSSGGGGRTIRSASSNRRPSRSTTPTPGGSRWTSTSCDRSSTRISFW